MNDDYFGSGPLGSSSLGSNLGDLLGREPATIPIVRPERPVLPQREVRMREEWDPSIKGHRRITEERYSQSEPFKIIYYF